MGFSLCYALKVAFKFLRKMQWQRILKLGLLAQDLRG
jgi:hypothetical protein